MNNSLPSQYLSTAMNKFRIYPSSLLDYYMNKLMYSSSLNQLNIHSDYQFIQSLNSKSIDSLFN